MGGTTATPSGYHHVEDVMGMAVSIDVRDEVEGRPGLIEVVEWLHRVDRVFSPYRENSAITRLGRGEVALDDCDDDVAEILALCERLRDDTGGAFDAFAVPAPNGTTFDPSGVVKGWSIERAAAMLEEHGLGSFTINAGGDIAVRGRPGPGEPWQVGIRHPDHRDRLALVLAAEGPTAIATSATYERGAHIIDPRTGNATTDLASVTIVGRDLTLTDAYATSVFVMGLTGLEWLLERPGYEGCAITHDDVLVSTPGFDALRR